MKTPTTLGELIDNLEYIRGMYGDELPVVSSSDYGDRGRTEQLNHIVDQMLCIPRKSAYSDSGYVFDENTELEIGDDIPDEQENKYFLVLRGK